MRCVIVLFMMLVATGCGRGVCGGFDDSRASSIEHPCGITVVYMDGKAYTMTPPAGIEIQTRYTLAKTKPGNATTHDGCVYELSPGWYGDADCAFPVQ